MESLQGSEVLALSLSSRVITALLSLCLQIMQLAGGRFCALELVSRFGDSRVASSLRSHNQRTVFAASSTALVVDSAHIRSPSADPAQPQFSYQAVPSSNSVGRNCARFVYRKRTVASEGFITQILRDCRFQLENRISFHPGLDQSFAPDMVVSSAFRVGTKLKLLNALLVQRDEHVGLLHTAQTSIEIVIR